MNIENPIALQFILQDDLYLLQNDKTLYNSIAAPVAEPTPAVQEILVQPEVITRAAINFNHLGTCKNGLLVLVHYTDAEFIAEAHLTALENILKRKEMAIAETAILNMAKHTEANFENISAHFNPQKILVLGSQALPAGIVPLKLNIPQQSGKQVALYSFSFDEMMDNNDHKKAFWEQMKNL